MTARLKRKTEGRTVSAALGERLRARRHALGLTLQEVAEESGLSAGFLSQLERNLSAPSLSSLASISHVLDAEVADFLDSTGGSLATRGRQRPAFSLKRGSSSYERISDSFGGHMLNGVILHEPPGYRSEPISHEGEELFYVLNGSITVELEDERLILHAGDSIHFASRRRHATWNHTTEPVSLLVVCTMDVFGDGEPERTEMDGTTVRIAT